MFEKCLPPPGSHESATTCKMRRRRVDKVLTPKKEGKNTSLMRLKYANHRRREKRESRRTLSPVGSLAGARSTCTRSDSSPRQCSCPVAAARGSETARAPRGSAAAEAASAPSAARVAGSRGRPRTSSCCGAVRNTPGANLADSRRVRCAAGGGAAPCIPGGGWCWHSPGGTRRRRGRSRWTGDC